MKPASFSIRFAVSAKKDLRRLPESQQLKVVKRILELASEPRPNGISKLQGADSVCRIRCGDYRIVYRIDAAEVIIVIIKIGHRSDVYKNL